MGDRIGNNHRFHLFGDQTGESLGDPHSNLADALGAKAFGRRQHEIRAIGFEQVDRTDVGGEAAADQRGDVGERFRRIAVPRNQQTEFIDRPEGGQGILNRQRRVIGAHGTASGIVWSRARSKNAASTAAAVSRRPEPAIATLP
jgi:hypothetical protein